VKLLGHGDMRVRQEAQFALVERRARERIGGCRSDGQRACAAARIWGLGQLMRIPVLNGAYLLSYKTL